MLLCYVSCVDTDDLTRDNLTSSSITTSEDRVGGALGATKDDVTVVCSQWSLTVAAVEQARNKYLHSKI